MRLRDDEGFTLIEAVVSIAIFAIVATAATFAIVSSARAASATELRVVAGHIAEQQLDRVVLLGADPTPAPQSGTIASEDRDFEVVFAATPDYGTTCDGYRDVSVTVSTVASGESLVTARLDTRIACPQGSLDGFGE